ncbi:MAG: VanW family protein [Deltaproteobacteria bacterium]|nr:VanW family protein [Deltaproteobacteria bacterium]
MATRPGDRSGPPAAIYVPQAGSSPSKGKSWGIRLGLTAGLLAAVGGGALFVKARYLPEAHVVPGVMIDGERVPDGADAAKVRSLVEARAAKLASRKVVMTLPGSEKPVHETTLGELGAKVDVEETAALAARIGKNVDLWSRIQVARAARDGKIDVPLRYRIDRDAALPVFEGVKEATDVQAVSARLDLDKHATIPEKDGRYVDIDGTLARVEGAIPQGRGDVTVELPQASFPPRVSSSFLKSLVIDTVVAEYETFFSRGGDQHKRGKNIDNAAQKLDGLVISPGETVSFNAVVGERSEANGFQKSWEIFKGEMVEGVGGGTCQVASTFHAVTFFGGFDVLERLPHSRPSAYIPMGLDSTVVYPGVDLKVRNPHAFPVVIHAKTEGNKLRVEMLGKMRPVEVAFGRELVSTIAYKRKIVEDSALSGKKVLVKQHGIKGYRIRRTRTLKYPDGTQRREDATDFYPPTTEIYHVPVGFDVALLPSLPGGEGEDADLGGNPSATPASAKAPASTTSSSTTTASTDAKPADAVEFQEAPGSHAPTSAQANPTKSLFLKR